MLAMREVYDPLVPHTRGGQERIRRGTSQLRTPPPPLVPFPLSTDPKEYKQVAGHTQRAASIETGRCGGGEEANEWDNRNLNALSSLSATTSARCS